LIVESHTDAVVLTDKERILEKTVKVTPKKRRKMTPKS